MRGERKHWRGGGWGATKTTAPAISPNSNPKTRRDQLDQISIPKVVSCRRLTARIENQTRFSTGSPSLLAAAASRRQCELRVKEGSRVLAGSGAYRAGGPAERAKPWWRRLAVFGRARRPGGDGGGSGPPGAGVSAGERGLFSSAFRSTDPRRRQASSLFSRADQTSAS